ncbi:uncharacterized protein N7443_009375 [Penicillium atrosanguineum]|uniref:uncharacterized protein n=1 Tax=Penicillium atrosanguineum TaxID=1132637 RepID=UPI0023A23FBC|nr:uncharacterized protein N7443_009375 [Penicillium atrosanguineum]KAJ5293422.1 hypothetical protein N7443_009375 [Penicillium atrosanguineum]
MPTDWLQCAVSFYIHNYVLARADGFPGYYDFLPRLYGSNAEAGYFRNSVEAVAQASYAQVKKMSPIYFHRSRQSYGLALTQLGFVLNNAAEAYSPATLAAVALLWMYDVIVGEDKLESRSPHRQGLLEIFRTRLSLNADGEKWINRPILGAIHMQNIDELPSFAGATPAVAPSPPFPRGVSLFEELLPRVTKIIIANATLIQRTPNRVEAIEGLRQLQRLFKDLDTWEESLPEEWLYKTCPNPKTTDRSPFPLAVVVFPTLSVGGMWTAKWLAQLSVLRSMVLFAPIALKIGVTCPPLAEIRKQIRSVAALLFSSIPYLLGHVAEDGKTKAIEDTPAFGAFFATRSLFVTAQLPGLPEEQVKWILDRLGEIGRERGYAERLFSETQLQDIE